MTIEQKLPHWEWKPSLQAVRHQSPTDSQNNIGYCHCPGFLPEIRSRILWLRVSCTSYTELEGFDMGLNWKVHPQGLALPPPKDAMQPSTIKTCSQLYNLKIITMPSPPRYPQ